MTSARALLQDYVASLGALRHPDIIGAYVLRNGREMEFRPRGDGWHRMEPKQCFRNATLTSFRKALPYVEGFCFVGKNTFPIHHAWNLRADDTVLDLTLPETDVPVYIGVEFTVEELTRATAPHAHYGLFDSPTGVNMPLLLQLDPDLHEWFVEVRAGRYRHPVV